MNVRRPHEGDQLTDIIEARFEVLDERFRSCGGDSRIERLYTGCRWTEGPAYFAAGRYVIFSDIPNDRILRWDETTGVTGVFSHPAGYANGHTVDRQGRLVSCEQGTRRVTRTEHDGSVTVLADRYRGQRFNSPNDVVERAGGSIWFTDPSYGINSDYEGHKAQSEIGACHVYRVRPGRDVQIVADDFTGPNGLAFSPDERQLYIADSEDKHIRRFDISEGDDAVLSGGEVFATCDAGVFDGLRLDDAGVSGRRPTTACTASTRTARCSGSCSSPRSWPTSRSAASSATRCSCAPRPPCTRSGSTSPEPNTPAERIMGLWWRRGRATGGTRRCRVWTCCTRGS
jgi:gluconolactonase